MLGLFQSTLRFLDLSSPGGNDAAPISAHAQTSAPNSSRHPPDAPCPAQPAIFGTGQYAARRGIAPSATLDEVEGLALQPFVRPALSASLLSSFAVELSCW
jgi:hypothetical protein